MALEYMENGLTSVKGRDCYFEKGSPVDSFEWELFKHLPEHTRMYGKSCIDHRSIERCFSSIKDSHTGLTIRTPIDQFRSFCEWNGLDFLKRDQDRFITVRVAE